MASKLHGATELTAALSELRNLNTAAWKAVLRDAVKVPMESVKTQATANLSKVSPGAAQLHKTYTGRIVAAGFAARSVALLVRIFPKTGTARAELGVRKEAFYAISFIEMGTAFIPRFPWLLPAFQASKDRGVRLVGEAMKARIDAIAKKWDAKTKKYVRKFGGAQ